jgi:hypothetical protein
MKNTTAIVIFQTSAKYKVYSLYVNTNDSLIKLVPTSESKTYGSLNGMYEGVIRILNANNFKVHKWNEFGTTFYNINFIDLDNPTQVNRYGITLEREQDCVQQV